MSQPIEQATAFVNAVVDGDPERARDMLSDELRTTMSAADIADEYDAMLDDMGGVDCIGEAMEILSDWPEKTQNEIAMVYVPLEGETYSEAITLIVAQVDGKLVISNVEWGRP